MSAQWAGVRFLHLVLLELGSLIVLTLLLIWTFCFDVDQSVVRKYCGKLVLGPRVNAVHRAQSGSNGWQARTALREAFLADF